MIKNPFSSVMLNLLVPFKKMLTKGAALLSVVVIWPEIVPVGISVLVPTVWPVTTISFCENAFKLKTNMNRKNAFLINYSLFVGKGKSVCRVQHAGSGKLNYGKRKMLRLKRLSNKLFRRIYGSLDVIFG